MKSTEQSELNEKINVYVVGDAGCGKSHFLQTYLQRDFDPEENIPTIIDSFDAKVNISKRKVDVTFWDTSGLEDYADIRKLSYPREASKHNYVFLCYSSVELMNFDNVVETWLPELLGNNFLAENVCLLGMKSDLIPKFRSTRVPRKAVKAAKEKYKLLGQRRCNTRSEKSIKSAMSFIYSDWKTFSQQRKKQAFMKSLQKGKQTEKEKRSVFEADIDSLGLLSSQINLQRVSQRNSLDLDRAIDEIGWKDEIV